MSQIQMTVVPVPRFLRLDVAAYAAIAVAAMLLFWLTRARAASLPFFAPWEFSFVEFCGAWLFAFWYLYGLALTPAAERPALWRSFAYFGGIAAIYIVLETRFEYLAEHQFVFNRIQNAALHDLGPLLIALAWPGATLARGLPRPPMRVARHTPLVRAVHFLEKPLVASVLFVGLLFVWLVPPLHFRAMIDPDLYALMNWSMILGGLLFWCMLLDPRPSPPAPVSFGVRLAVVGLVMIPQGLGGAIVALAQSDLYPYYDLCGRIYPELGALYDQALGGLVIWIPSTMMGIAGAVFIVNAMRRSEAAAVKVRRAAGATNCRSAPV